MISVPLPHKKKYYKHVLIIGPQTEIPYYIQLLKEKTHKSVRITGIVTYEGVTGKVDSRRVLGTVNEFEKILNNHLIDSVFIISDTFPHFEKAKEIIKLCEEEGIETSLITEFYKELAQKGMYDELYNIIYGMPIFNYNPGISPAGKAIKRAGDVILSIIALILLTPLFILIILLIKLDSPGPAIFKQTRVGEHGRHFEIYKFRTMYEFAAKKKASLLKHSEVDGPVFKMENDPRITRVGKLLRKWSVDEMLQFHNVLRGEMSLVGPRPALPSEVEKYKSWYRKRLSVKPGIMCLWQVEKRCATGFEEWMRSDIYYVDHWSLWLDFTILIRAIPAVIFGKGAK